MKRIFLGLALAAVSGVASARVNLSKELKLSVEGLTEIERKLEKAANRPEEQKEFMAYYEIDSLNGAMLGCGPNLPDKDGLGCLLNIRFGNGSGVSLSFSKKLVIKGKTQQVTEALAKLDPNATEEHQHFGSLFTKEDTYGSHYYCQPEGEKGKKVWGCFLYLSESVN